MQMDCEIKKTHFPSVAGNTEEHSITDDHTQVDNVMANFCKVFCSICLSIVVLGSGVSRHL